MSAVTKAAQAGTWDPVYKLHFQINQSFATRGDDAGLERFHETALKLCAPPHLYELVRVKDIRPFEIAVESVIAEGVRRAKSDPGIHALFFGYFFDGGESCSGDLYLCRKYSADNDWWASEFRDSDIIEGPLVVPYLDYDPDIGFESGLKTIAEEYVEACFLAATIRAWRKNGSHEYPFGFAEHEGDIIRIHAI